MYLQELAIAFPTESVGIAVLPVGVTRNRVSGVGAEQVLGQDELAPKFPWLTHRRVWTRLQVWVWDLYAYISCSLFAGAINASPEQGAEPFNSCDQPRTRNPGGRISIGATREDSL